MSSTSTTVRRGRHAVVIGASMAGLSAAAAVAGHYDEVTVIDRDELPDHAAHRKGVPQSKHAHGLQPGGLQALEKLLPGLTNELDADGACGGDVSGQGQWYVGGGTLARGISGTFAIGISRPFLEHHVRARVQALPNVTVLDRTEVVRPIAENGRVVGVEVASVDTNDTELLETDLVVDASGRVSKLPEWLDALGYAKPVEEQVHCKMAYLTRKWKIRDDVMDDDVVRVVTPDDQPHFGVIIAQEDGSHIVTVGGLMNDGPEKDDQAYLEFAARLGDPTFVRLLDDATPLTDLQPSHFPYSRRRRYDKLASFPSGLIALGDSIASFNPMYGQGMSVAAIEAVALRDLLAKGDVAPKAFHKRAHRVEDVAWKIVTGGDLRFAGIEGKRTPDMKIMNGYLDRLTLAARTDATLAAQFLKVAAFVDPPQAFFKPSVVWRVLRGSRAAKRSATASPMPAASAAATG